MPRFMKKLPKTLLNTTIVAQIQVFTRSRAVSVLIRWGRRFRLPTPFPSSCVPSIAGAGGNRRRFGRLVCRHKLLALLPQRHVLPGFLGQAPALRAVEDGLS